MSTLTDTINGLTSGYHQSIPINSRNLHRIESGLRKTKKSQIQATKENRKEWLRPTMQNFILLTSQRI